MRCNRCDWTGSQTEAEEHARETQHWLCIVGCGRSLRPDEKQTCLACLSQTRRNLRQLVDLYALLPPVIHAAYATDTRFGEPRSTETPLLGGAALSLTADGTAGSVNSSRTGDRSHAADQVESDPPAVLAVLASWEDDWRHTRGEPAGPKATMSRVTDYLIRLCGWAADEHPGFDEFAHEVHRLTRLLEATTGLADPQEISGVQCISEDCGGRLVRDYFCSRRFEDCEARGCDRRSGKHVDGQSDYWRCSRCDRLYDQKSYFLAVHEQLIAAQEAS